MWNEETFQLEEEETKLQECLEPNKLKLMWSTPKNNTLEPQQIKDYWGILGTQVDTMSDDDIKKDFLKLIDRSGLDDEFLLKKMQEWIATAVYEWPKGTILTDWKTITQIVKLVFQMKWKLKDNSQIQIVNAFGNTNITL